MNYIGIDIGATNIRIGIIDENQELIAKQKLFKPQIRNEYDVANIILDSINKIDAGNLGGVGIGAAGLLDLESGDVSFSSNMPIHRIKLAEPLIRSLHLPVVVLNDASAAAYGEYLARKDDVQDLAYISIGTGIGAGIIIDGDILMGRNGNAHEAGCIIVDFNSKARCSCGGLGHWEAFASGTNMPKIFREYVSSRKADQSANRLLISMDESKISAEDIFGLAANGDAIASDFIDYIMKINTAGLASIINLFDPQLIVLGGSVALNNRDAFIRGINKYINSFVTVHEYRIDFAKYGDDAGIIGAAAAIRSPSPRLSKLINKYMEKYG